MSPSAVASTKFVVAVLVVNGPLAEARGGIFMRYATLAFESSRQKNDFQQTGVM